jgi:RHS repeat-associated protein
MLTNSAGAVTDAYEYDAFGNMISSAGTTPNVYLYRGERYDSDLSLYYLRARWYNPVTGRFMTRDPYEGSIYDPASLHRYNYARANPANFIDPSGRAASSDYVYLGLNTLAKAVVLTATGEAIGCAYYALASATDLVGQHIGQDFTQLGLLWQGCEAEITVKQHIQGILTNLLFIGIGKGIGWLLEDAEAGLPCAECFAAGTPVHTDHGTISIERIKTGDKVWARDSITGKNELQTVTAIAPQHRDQLVELRIAGEKSPLRTTPVHPFRARRDASAAAHWIKAGDLKAGDLLETEEGRWVAIQSVTPIQGLAVVYNFTVDKDHDYFVGETGFLVHNANCGCGEDPLTWLEDPNLIGFTQDSIGNTIHLPDGSEIPLQGYINALQSGEINPGDVEPIRVFGGPDGSLWSIDNRRLYAARQAGVPANTRAATREEALRRKITTKNNGGLPCVRGR